MPDNIEVIHSFCGGANPGEELAPPHISHKWRVIMRHIDIYKGRKLIEPVLEGIRVNMEEHMRRAKRGDVASIKYLDRVYSMKVYTQPEIDAHVAKNPYLLKNKLPDRGVGLDVFHDMIYDFLDRFNAHSNIVLKEDKELMDICQI